MAGIVLLAACGVLFAGTYRIPRSPFLPLGPEFYPRVILGVLAILSAALIVSDLRTSKPRSTDVARRRGPPVGGPVVLTYLLFGAYVATMPLLGFRVATALFVTALAWVLGPRTFRGFVVAAIAGVFTAVLTAAIFESYLRVLLPRGRLP